MALFLQPHLGCGDMLLCNAMVRHLAARYTSVTLVCKREYAETVGFMLRDVGGVSLCDEGSPVVGEPTILRPSAHGVDWARGMYASAGLADLDHVRGFRVERDPAREEAVFQELGGSSGRYVFVHDDGPRGFAIDAESLPDMRVIRPGLMGAADCASTCVFDYCALIERAAEFHAIDSCFAWLHELMDLNPCAVMHTGRKSGRECCERVFHASRWTFV